MQVFIDSPDSLLASLLSTNETGKLILISGQSGSGKTHWCLELVKHAKTQGINAVGLVSPAVFEAGIKIGIELVDVASGFRQRLATRRGKSDIGQFPSDWDFNDEALYWGNSVLGQLENSQLLILDEIGPLELQHGGGLVSGIGLISAGRYRLACVTIRPSLLGIAQTIWPWGLVNHVRTNDITEVPA